MFPNMSVLGIQLSCMEKINELTKCNKLYIYIYIQPFKKGNSDIYNTMNEPKGHYIK